MDRYAHIFEQRKEMKQQMEPFLELKKQELPSDDIMWAYNIDNMHEYAILKIQKWWKRRAVLQKFNLVIENGKKVRNQFKSVQMLDKIAKIELELEMIKNAREAARSKIDEKTNIKLIINCQRRYRLHAMLRKVRQRRAGQSHLEPQLVLFRTARDFVEHRDALFPSNYTISVTKYKMDEQKKIFNVALKLNNYPERSNQQMRIFHDISGDYEEQKLLQVNQNRYFENLVCKRVVFVRDTDA